MYSNDENGKGPVHFFLSWQFLFIKVLACGLVSIYLIAPTGSLSGKIAIEQEGTNLYTYALGERKVVAVATGPSDNPCERGVFVDEEGNFRVEDLPVGQYELHVRAPGFSDEYSNGLFVDDGKITKMSQPVKLRTLAPSCNVVPNANVVTTKSTPFLWAYSTSCTHLSIKVYKKDLRRLMNGKELEDAGYKLSNTFGLERSESHERALFQGEKPVYEFSRDISAAESSTQQQFQFGKPLPPGDYIAQCTGKALDGKKEVFSAATFTVTDLGLIVKKAPDQTLVRAVDLNTLKPVEGATISIYGADRSKCLVSGNTDTRGFVTLHPERKRKAPDSGYDQLLVVGALAESRAYDGMYEWHRRQDEGYRVYIYTDRPVYRLGQTVYYKGIIRQIDPTRLINPGKGIKVGVSIETPDGNELSSCEMATNDHGTFHGSIKVPDEGSTGYYVISLSLPGGHTESGTFQVSEYRKPEFTVEVKPVAPQVVAGMPAQMHVKASYFFGAPVANARVKYSVYSTANLNAKYAIMPRAKYSDYFDDWEDDEEGDSYSHYAGGYGGSGDYEESQYVQLDANGEATINIDTKPKQQEDADDKLEPSIRQGDRDYNVEVEVTDLTRMTVTGSGSLLVAPANFELFVAPDSYVTRASESLSVQATAINYQGKPVANQPVTLKLMRNVYDRRGDQPKLRGVENRGTVDAVTDAAGKVKATFATTEKWPSDTFQIVAESKDDTGHLSTGSASVWISNHHIPYVAGTAEQAQKQPFDIKLDKKLYKQGDVARVMIAAPLQGNEGVEALVSVEGETIYDYKLVSLSATASLVEVPIKPAYLPNAFISIAFVGTDHQFYQTEKMIRVSPADNALDLSITTDKQIYKPGESVKYTIKATHVDGRPAPNTELSLAVVDESIFSIAADNTLDMLKFFYHKRQNLVLTSCSFPQEYSGGPDKDSPRVRDDFRDMACWNPELITDKNGLAYATVKLPDNLTTWRATVRGIDTETDVGASIQKVVATQDLIVRLGMPRFFTQDDRGTISAVVHNYTDKPQSVKLTCTLSPELSTEKPLAQTINVAPDKSSRCDWPVTAALSGTATIKVVAIGQKAGDAVQQKLPIRPLGIPDFSVKAGLVTNENATIHIPIGHAKDACPGTVKYQVNLASSSIGPVLGNFKSLIDYPYGCTEQTLSRMVPSIVAFKLHKKLGLPLSREDLDRFDDVYSQSISKLQGYRHPDGGWGWWANDESQSYLTCLVVDGLNLMNSCNHYADTHDQWIKEAVVYLKRNLTTLHKQLTDPKLVPDWYVINEYRSDMCFTLYTIGLFEPLPKLQSDWILKQHKQLPPEALAYLTMAMKRGGRLQDANMIYRRLIDLANVDGQFMNWDPKESMVKKFAEKPLFDAYTYRYTGVESTALALRAVLVMEPDNTKRIESVKQWLLLQRTKDGWENTKTTAEVFEALLQEELQAKAKWPTNFKADATLEQRLLKEYSFSAANAYQQESSIELKTGANQEDLQLTKHGTGRLYYSSLMTCVRKLKVGDTINEKAYPPGLHLSRKFFRLVPGPMKTDGSIHFRTVPIADGKVKAGETILMKVYVQAPVAIPYVKLEAALPSGAEVVEESVSDSSLENADGSGSTIDGDWGSPWWSHQDVLDDRIVFFGTSLPAGKSEFHTLLRLESPGKLNVEPINLEGMYTKKVRGYSQLDSLEVQE